VHQLGRLAHARGAYAEAITLLDESRAIQEELGARDRLARVLNDLGLSARRAGEPARALGAHRDSLALFQELRNREGIAECLQRIAGVLIDRGELMRAVRLLAAATSLRGGTEETAPLAGIGDALIDPTPT
jgi:tetratricopeptide (TPR) repeat protein